MRTCRWALRLRANYRAADDYRAVSVGTYISRLDVAARGEGSRYRRSSSFLHPLTNCGTGRGKRAYPYLAVSAVAFTASFHAAVACTTAQCNLLTNCRLELASLASRKYRTTSRPFHAAFCSQLRYPLTAINLIPYRVSWSTIDPYCSPNDPLCSTPTSLRTPSR